MNSTGAHFDNKCFSCVRGDDFFFLKYIINTEKRIKLEKKCFHKSKENCLKCNVKPNLKQYIIADHIELLY